LTEREEETTPKLVVMV
jgi:hypothetical protein